MPFVDPATSTFKSNSKKTKVRARLDHDRFGNIYCSEHSLNIITVFGKLVAMSATVIGLLIYLK